LFAAAILLVTPGPSAAASSTVFVDNPTDGVECPNALPSIEAGVEAASPGDTVLVCAGTYPEEVTLEADESGISVKARGPLGSVVVDGQNTMQQGFLLNGANGVLVEGFVVQRYHDNIVLMNANDNVIRGNETMLAWDHDGIELFANAHRNLVENNIAHDNQRPIGCGISVGGGSSDNIVRHNTVFNNANIGILLGGGLLGPAGRGNVIADNSVFDNGEPVAGANRGTGILNAITPGSVIEHNRVTSNNAFGIRVLGATSDDVTVAHNFVEANGSMNDDDGIRIELAPNALVQHNLSRLNRHDGVHVITAVGTVVEHNVLEDNGTPGVGNGCGIDVDSASSGTVVRNNVIRNHDRAGVRIRISSGNAVTGNETMDNPGDGIQLANGDNNTIEGNRANRNGRDGIRSDTASSGNVFTANNMFQNGEHDAHDDNRAANTWTDNHCRTDFPAGTIC
jgi:parallel beta-helix repeat protein